MSGRPDQILRDAALLFAERNAVYGDNFRMVAQVLATLFPKGVSLRTPEEFALYHNFELKVVKLCRFAASGLTHVDSIEDDIVYSAICRHLLLSHPLPEASHEF